MADQIPEGWSRAGTVARSGSSVVAAQSEDQTPILERLAAIDTAIIDELATSKGERELIGERLAALADRQGTVSEVVFERVRTDYSGQLERLEARAEKLKQQARAGYAELETLLAEAEQSVESARLDREEIELRHSLGELDEKEHKSRIGRVQKVLGERESELEALLKLKQRFVLAFDSEAELRAPTVQPNCSAGTSEPLTESTAALPEESDWEGVETELGEGADSKPLPATPAGSMSEAQTAILPPASEPLPPHPARLVSEAGEVTELGSQTLIGRAPDNQICIDRPEVSRRHAEILLTDEGYLLRDLGSENGTYINGERIDQHCLTDGDLLLIGAEGMVFHCS